VNNPFGICTAIEAHRPTIFAGIPSLFAYLLRGVSPFRSTNVESIRVVTNTGGTIPGPILEDLLECFPHSRVFLNYGLTETYRTTYLDPALVRDHPTSIGRGIPGVAVCIVREDGSVAAPGEEGEIVHRGDYICMGYWNEPQATARVIRPDPLAPPGVSMSPRAFFTGDNGVIDERGLLYFRGRRDHQLKSMGIRVSPSEVEAVLYHSALVKEVAVFGMKHDFLGDQVWAAVVPSGSSDNVTKALRDYAREAMSQHMAPTRYLVFQELPKTRTGKIDYVALKERAAAEPPAFGTRA
jgi:acyl-coenzyme A synthetase/AMP-(fatty) acid ligase